MEGYTKFKTEEMGEEISRAISSFELKANDKYAKASLQTDFTSFKNWVETKAGFITQSNAEYALSEIFAKKSTLNGEIGAYVKVWAGGYDTLGAAIEAKIDGYWGNTGIDIKDGEIWLNSPTTRADRIIMDWADCQEISCDSKATLPRWGTYLGDNRLGLGTASFTDKNGNNISINYVSW